MAYLRSIILDVEVQAGNQSSSAYSAPGLWAILERIPRANWPAFIRGDSDWGSDAAVMTEAEQHDIGYLFKRKRLTLPRSPFRELLFYRFALIWRQWQQLINAAIRPDRQFFQRLF